MSLLHFMNDINKLCFIRKALECSQRCRRPSTLKEKKTDNGFFSGTDGVEVVSRSKVGQFISKLEASISIYFEWKLPNRVPKSCTFLIVDRCLQILLENRTGGVVYNVVSAVCYMCTKFVKNIKCSNQLAWPKVIIKSRTDGQTLHLIITWWFFFS